MITIATATHNPKWLPELIVSLNRQTYSDPIEWVVLFDGITATDVVNNYSHGPVKVIEYDSEHSVGRAKKKVFDAASGDIIIELDHDDLLTDNAVEIISDVMSGGVDFTYSNFAEFEDGTWEPNSYSDNYGWKSRPFSYDGHKLLEMIAPKSTPHAYSMIWYAPNHVRAWRSDFYRNIGGHSDMAIADDYDLVCRSALSGKVEKIDACLYLYRNHGGGNTFRLKNAEIQQQAYMIRDKYLHDLINKYATDHSLLRVDLGARIGQPPGYVGVDLTGSDINADLRGPWPFATNSVGVFRAQDFLEHLPDPIHTMNEMYRCLLPGGWILTSTPSTDGRGAWQDPTHCSFWNQNSWFYYTRKEQQKYVPGIEAKFIEARWFTHYPGEWERTNEIPYVVFDGWAYKGDTFPGYRGF